ncbi:MAG: hypothetical protein A2X81_04110 [Desulfobacterales bacterium GWB2_56_26]|nr:MAG: hypothetical protein A2X81_04110 [Desulfobacterales bacterium GWB2_56_26]
MFRQTSKHLFLLCSLGVLFFWGTMPTFAEPVKIGAIFALTGKAVNSNRAAIHGTRLAIREINEQGGILGEPVELLVFDNESTPIGSHLAAEKAVGAGVTGIIGASWSSHSLAVAKVAAQHHLPMISPISTIPSLTDIGKSIFRVCYTDDFQGSALARFAFTDLAARRAVVFIDISSDFSMSIARIFRRTFESLGGKVVKEVEYKTGQEDYRPAIREALLHQADVVFLSGYDESGYLAAALQAAGSTAIPIGSDGWDAPSFFSSGGNRIVRGYFINHWLPDAIERGSRAFIEKFQGEGDILAPTALAYDAVHILAAAIEKAGTQDKFKVVDSLRSLRGFKGVTGDISFTPRGDAAKQACIAEIRAGVPHLLKCVHPDKHE